MVLLQGQDSEYVVLVLRLVLFCNADDLFTDEEEDLVKFFGADYQLYRERVGTGIPFIR